MLTLRLCGIAAGLVWWLCVKAFSSRTMYLVQYVSQEVVSPRWEVFVPMPTATLIVSLCGLAFWLGGGEFLWRQLRRGIRENHDAPLRQWAWGVRYLVAASIPWLIDLAIHWQTDEPLIKAEGVWGPTVWQPLWLAAFSGLAADRFARAMQAIGLSAPVANKTRHPASNRWLASSVFIAATLCGLWWFMQSQRAFDEFMLGFNDCGHFAQRIANTAHGRGWLVESPVLPRFWDHFNPGLILLVPLWIAWPDMSLFSFLQALSLAGSAPLVMHVARSLGAKPFAACLWALAWLMQPVLGQMNLAYTYGWHPISLAIPLMFLALGCLLNRRWWSAVAALLLASSMEEGVLVIIATTAATLGAIELCTWVVQRSLAAGTHAPWLSTLASQCRAARRVSVLLPARSWLAIAMLATITFLLVYRFSGLAEFQTGRFHTLGSSSLEILLSPVLRPETFWGLLLRSRNCFFLAGILLPCGVLAALRAWPLLLATAVPVGVLAVWEHLPAQSLAFHYPSVLLPVFWLAAIAGATVSADTPTHEAANAKHTRRHFAGTALSLGAAALMTSLVASIHFGQLPWSNETLRDVREMTYAPNSEFQRRVGAADNEFAHEQLAEIRERGESVLATGRLATHLVGCSELETVGQFAERRQALARLTPGEDPLRRYGWLILDRREAFQQLRTQTAALEQEALASGFSIVADRFDIVVLRRE